MKLMMISVVLGCLCVACGGDEILMVPDEDMNTADQSMNTADMSLDVEGDQKGEEDMSSSTEDDMGETDADMEQGEDMSEVVLDDFDRRMLERIAQAYQAFGKSSSTIWLDEFRFDRMPLVMLRRDQGVGMYAYVFHVENVTGAVVQTLPSDLSILGEVRKVPMLSTYPDANSPFEVHWMLGGRDAVLIPYGKTGQPFDDLDDPLWLVFVVHEAFHNYQDSIGKWLWPSDWTQSSMGYPLNEENMALAMIEDELLLKALASSGDMQKARIEEFLLVRQERKRRWEVVSRLDENQEESEGMARCMEVGFDDALGRNGKERLIQDIQIGLDTTFLEFGAGDWLIQDRHYSTGAALCLLLDQGNEPWKTSLQDDKIRPADVLRTRYPVMFDQMRLDGILTQYMYTSRVENAKRYDYTSIW